MKDKVVIITGGSSGIGKALAFTFGSRGSKIFITGRNAAELQKTVAELQARGIAVAALVADAKVAADNERMAAEVMRVYGRMDVLIANAGISMRALFEEVDLAVIRQVMEINFFGVVYATKYCLPEIKRNKGSIVGMSSIAGYRGLPARSGYSASKFALNGFLETLRTEYLHEDVHVLTACPGFTASNIRTRALVKDGTAQGDSSLDEGKVMTAEEVAEHIYRAVVKRKRQIILTTNGRLAVFLNKWWPWLADRLVYNALKKEPNSPLK
jgi:short-subunit dehydrogenase